MDNGLLPLLDTSPRWYYGFGLETQRKQTQVEPGQHIKADGIVVKLILYNEISQDRQHTTTLLTKIIIKLSSQFTNQTDLARDTKAENLRRCHYQIS